MKHIAHGLLADKEQTFARTPGLEWMTTHDVVEKSISIKGLLFILADGTPVSVFRFTEPFTLQATTVNDTVTLRGSAQGEFNDPVYGRQLVDVSIQLEMVGNAIKPTKVRGLLSSDFPSDWVSTALLCTYSLEVFDEQAQLVNAA